MSNSVRPHRRQPTRLPYPWDYPGKYTGVGCHFFLQCMKVKSESEVAQSCLTLSDLMDCGLPGSSIHGIFQARVLEWVATSFSYICMYLVSTNPKLPIYPHPAYPLVTVKLFSMSVSLFLFHKQVYLYHFLESTYKWYHMVFVFLCLTSLSVIISMSIHVATNGIIYFFFMAE